MQSDRNIHTTSDSSNSVAGVTNVERNIFTVLTGARALAGSSSQPPEIADSENKIGKNFPKSIIKRAVHPSIVCSTPFHSQKPRKSFENISTISNIGSDTYSRISPVIEKNGCEENLPKKQKNMSKENDCTNAHCRNKSASTNNSINTSVQVDLMKDRTNKKGNIPACSKQDQKNLTRSGKENEVNSTVLQQHILDGILELATSKRNDNKLDIKEKTIVRYDSKQVPIDQHEDNLIPDNVPMESKIVTAHTTTDDEEVITAQSLRQEEKKYITVTNQTQSSMRGVFSTKIPSDQVVKHSKVEINSDKDDMEIHSKSKRTASNRRSKQVKRKNTEEYHESSPSKKNRTADRRGQSSTRYITYIHAEDSEDSSESNEEFETDNIRTAEKSRFPRKKGYNNGDYQLNVRNKLKCKKILYKQERLRSTKRKHYNSDEEDEQKIRTKKKFRKPERNKSFHQMDYNNVDETELSEEPNLRKKYIIGKIYSSDEENEENRIRDKRRVQKRGTSKYCDGRGFSSNEEAIEMNEKNNLWRHKSNQKARSLRRKEYSSDEEGSEYIEVHKVRGQHIINKIRSSKNCNRNKYTDFEENRYKEYKRGKKVPQELVRVKSSKYRIHHSPEISEDDRRSTRKTLHKQGSSKLTLRKTFRNPHTSRDSNQNHNAVKEKFIFKRPRSKSSKRLEYYTSEESSNYSDEVSYISDTSGEIRKRRQSKKLLYVVETNSTDSDRNKQKQVKERHRSVSQKKYKFVHDTEQKLKTKRRIIGVISEGSDIEEDYMRKSIRFPSRHKSKCLEKVRPSSSKPYAVFEDECESPSPQKISYATKHGRLSRRDIHVSEQVKNARSMLKMNNKSSREPPDPNDENFVTPINQKMTLQQPGMTTIIRGIVDQQLVEFNEAKEINVSIEESDKTLDRIQIPNEEIEEVPNIGEDGEIKIVSEDNSYDGKADILTENSGKNILSKHIGKMSGILDDNSNFKPIGSVKILKRLARRPHMNNSELHPSLSVFVINEPKKSKKRLLNIIGLLKKTKSVQGHIVDAGVQTSLPGTKTNFAELPPEDDIEVHTVKDVPHESENVVSSSVKSSRLPVMSKKRIPGTTSINREDGPVENLATQEEDIHKGLDQDVTIVPSVKVPAKRKSITQSKTSHIRDDNLIKMEPLEVKVIVRNQPNPYKDCLTEENKQDLSIVKAGKGKVRNQIVMASYEDAYPEETPEKCKRRTSRYALNTKEYDGIEIEPTEMVPPSIPNDPVKPRDLKPEDNMEPALYQGLPVVKQEEVAQNSRRRTPRSTLNSKDDGTITKSRYSVPSENTEISSNQDESFKQPEQVPEQSQRRTRGSMSNTKEDDNEMYSTDLASQEESTQIIADQNVPFVKPLGVPLKRRKKVQGRTSRKITIDEDEEDTLDSKSSKAAKIVLHYDNVLSTRKSESTSNGNKKKGKALTKRNPKSTDEEGPTLRRSTREKKTVDPFWWSSILGSPDGFNEKKAKRRNTTDSSSISPTKTRGRPKRTTQETRSRKKETKEQNSRLTDEENSVMEYNELYTNYVTETPSLSKQPNKKNKLTSKKKKRQRLTVLNKNRGRRKRTTQETRSGKKKTKEQNSRLIDEENGVMEYNELDTNDVTETPSLSKQPNVENKLTSKKKKRQRLTVLNKNRGRRKWIRQETRLGKKEIKEQKSRLTDEENSVMEYNALYTNDVTETPSLSKQPNEENKLTPKKKKQQHLTMLNEIRKLVYEDNDGNEERSNALETYSSTEASQKLTEFYNNSIEGNLNEENSSS